ncbi:MAG: hypothetical protein MUP45_00390 [Candidatus Marinimicrobia bacterium]|nr:hypothetical protein [Candidatus Neomarinimicrobiota bacterium]
MNNWKEVAIWTGIYWGFWLGSFIILEIPVFAMVSHLPEARKEAGAAILSLIAFFFSYLFASYIAKKTRRKGG